MRVATFLAICLLVLGALPALLGQTLGVVAIGIAADDLPIQGLPADDESSEEIKPQVKYVLLGPSSQSGDAPPTFIARFITTSNREELEVLGNENWYLDVDINKPGWLYIFEYFPKGGDSEGEWIAYKWQLTEGGIWRLGPFTPRDNELEGQHIYAIWFYGDGQWAGEDPNMPQSKFVYWKYSQGHPSEEPDKQILSQPLTTTAKEVRILDRLRRLVVKPAALTLCSSVSAIVGMLGFYIYWSYSRRRGSRSHDELLLSSEAEPETIAAEIQQNAVGAKIALPNGIELQLSSKNRVIGRGDLARALDLDALALISRRHFEVKFEDERFYIEDLGSANGTRLNGEDISNKGPVSLNDNDVIEPAGAICLKFYIL